MSNEPPCTTWWRAALCGALLAAGCTTVANPVSCADGFCHDPTLPFCDVDGTIGGGQRLTCIAVACAPLEFEACRGDEAIVCNATGDDYDVTHCAGGCSAEAGGCAATHIIPKYLPAVCDQLATEPELTISESMTLDTNADASCNGGIVDQINGPDICVLRYGTIKVVRNKTLTVTGERALALVADQGLTIDGILDVSANLITNGPGGGTTLSGNGGALALGAGGGAGFRTAGAPGGTATDDGGAHNGGAASENPALNVELLGGTRSNVDSATQISGGGGGAATLISCRAGVSLLGTIDAGGGGGAGAVVTEFFALAASGGGSGGNVVLQGMAVEVTGQAFANGGGGGAGTQGTSMAGARGEDGTRSENMSARGGVNPSGGGTGGDGGRGNAEPTVGKRTSNNTSPGAGGGSTGFFQTYTPAGVTPTLAPAAVSPPFQPNRMVATR